LGNIPLQTHCKSTVQNADFEGAVWGFIEIDYTIPWAKAEKINITVPAFGFASD